jgi:hypothetical protein
MTSSTCNMLMSSSMTFWNVMLSWSSISFELNEDIVCVWRRKWECDGIGVKWAQTMGGIYRVGRQNLEFLVFWIFWALTLKTVSFSVQRIEFTFKQSNLNSNGPIKKCRITTTHRPQRRMVMRTVLLGLTQARAIPLGCYHSTRLKHGRYRPVRRALLISSVHASTSSPPDGTVQQADATACPTFGTDGEPGAACVCGRLCSPPNCPMGKWELLTVVRRSKIDWSDHKGNTGTEERVLPYRVICEPCTCGCLNEIRGATRINHVINI